MIHAEAERKRNAAGQTAWDLAQENEALKGTAAEDALRDRETGELLEKEPPQRRGRRMKR